MHRFIADGNGCIEGVPEEANPRPFSQHTNTCTNCAAAKMTVQHITVASATRLVENRPYRGAYYLTGREGIATNHRATLAVTSGLSMIAELILRWRGLLFIGFEEKMADPRVEPHSTSRFSHHWMFPHILVIPDLISGEIPAFSHDINGTI
ncbi:unnamed protein product [Protopolystoma xenopodis]|uniref:Uncharacterized protein n=1 Tax=Protopolystoma xenopodis TaxID=117903 RepID=A0A448X1J3_9PLAT|nr:unnamed protein product [Protopolystoma xenopodis]